MDEFAPAPVSTQAAVVSTPGAAFSIQNVELGALEPDEVLVRIEGSGVCQTDMHMARREYPVPFPVVLGHEGAGTVVAAGDAVSDRFLGDPVILTYPYCGRCEACAAGRRPYCEHGFALSFGGARLDGRTALTHGGRALHGHIFQQSSFAAYAIVNARNSVVVPEWARHIPLWSLGPFGCSLQTGAGTVINSLNVQTGDSIAVVGVGAVGMAAVMAAKARGAARILVADIDPARLALALDLGASDAIDCRGIDLAVAITDIVPNGVDHAIELSGRPENLNSALAATRMGGKTALVAGTPSGTLAEIDMNLLLNGRHLVGAIQGDAESETFIPELLRLHEGGEFPFERLITAYDFADINRAADDLRSGATIKPVLRMTQPRTSTP